MYLFIKPYVNNVFFLKKKNQNNICKEIFIIKHYTKYLNIVLTIS
jgi:hypothetical protein